MDGQREGLCRKNILAGFTHLHALGTPEWAGALMDAPDSIAEQNKIKPPVFLMDGFEATPEKRAG